MPTDLPFEYAQQQREAEARQAEAQRRIAEHNRGQEQRRFIPYPTSTPATQQSNSNQQKTPSTNSRPRLS